MARVEVNMGASHWQHSNFSVWTNWSYILTGAFIALTQPQFFLQGLGIFIIGAGSFWYHKEGKRSAVPFDFFGMYFTLLSISLLFTELHTTYPLHKLFFLGLILVTPVLKSSWAFHITGTLFGLMLLSIGLSSIWGALAVVTAFGASFFVRQITHIGLDVPENEGVYHGIWHLLTNFSFILTLYVYTIL